MAADYEEADYNNGDKDANRKDGDKDADYKKGDHEDTDYKNRDKRRRWEFFAHGLAFFSHLSSQAM